MNLVYAVMWLLIAVILIYMGIRDKTKAYIFFSIYFIFSGIWWAAAFFTNKDMFHGTLGWIFRGITAVFLIIGIIFYPNVKKHFQQKQ